MKNFKLAVLAVITLTASLGFHQAEACLGEQDAYNRGLHFRSTVQGNKTASGYFIHQVGNVTIVDTVVWTDNNGDGCYDEECYESTEYQSGVAPKVSSGCNSL